MKLQQPHKTPFSNRHTEGPTSFALLKACIMTDYEETLVEVCVSKGP